MASPTSPLDAMPSPSSSPASKRHATRSPSPDQQPRRPSPSSSRLVAVLTFTHDCTHLACRDTGCLLCTRAPSKRCHQHVAPRASLGDAVGVRAPCGATVRVEVVPGRLPSLTPAQSTGDETPASCDRDSDGHLSSALPSGACIKLALVNANVFDMASQGFVVMAQGAGRPPNAVTADTPPDLRSWQTLIQSLELASLWTRGSANSVRASRPTQAISPDTVALECCRDTVAAPPDQPNQPNPSRRTASLQTVCWTAASDRLALVHADDIDMAATINLAANANPCWTPLSGAAVRLVACAVDGVTGDLCSGIFPAVSDPFVIHSQPHRVVKPNVALTTDPVTSLPGIAGIAARRLANLATSSAALRLPVHVHAVHTVADLRRLIACVNASAALDNDVRNEVGLARTVWSRIKEAATAAVEPDFRLRAWFAHDNAYGLVFACTDGVPAMGVPLIGLCGVAMRAMRVPPGVRTLPVVGDGRSCIVGHAIVEMLEIQPDAVASMTADARRDWELSGHPGWTIITTPQGRTFDDVDALRAFIRGNVVHCSAVLNVQA